LGDGRGDLVCPDAEAGADQCAAVDAGSAGASGNDGHARAVA
jgi:hypothetical protein